VIVAAPVFFTTIVYVTVCPVDGFVGTWYFVDVNATAAGCTTNCVLVNNPFPRQIPVPSMYTVFPIGVGTHTAFASARNRTTSPPATAIVFPVWFAVSNVPAAPTVHPDWPVTVNDPATYVIPAGTVSVYRSVEITCVPVFVNVTVNSMMSPMFGFAFVPVVTLIQSFTVVYVAPATSAVADACVCVYIAPVIVCPHTLVHVTFAMFVIIVPHTVTALAGRGATTGASSAMASAIPAAFAVMGRVRTRLAI
jgi:hypothetical protein